MLQRIAPALSLVAVFALAGAAFAGNGAGPNKSSASISAPVVVPSSTLAAPSGTASTSGPRFGDTVTFDVSTNQTNNPFVNVRCYQNAALVENSWASFWPTNGTFVLGSPAWTGGAADCTAELGMYVNSNKYKVLASSSFQVSA